jgi:hypothetical protein
MLSEVRADEAALFPAVTAPEDLPFYVYGTPAPVFVRDTAVGFVAREGNVLGKAAAAQGNFAGGAEETGRGSWLWAEEAQLALLSVVFSGFMRRNRLWTIGNRPFHITHSA